MQSKILSAAILVGSMAAGASAANIALNTAEPWLTYGDAQVASSTMTSHSNAGWAYDGNEGSYPWISGPAIGENSGYGYNPPHWTYTTWDVNATVNSVTVKPSLEAQWTMQEFQVQYLNIGGDPNNNADWTTFFTVSDVGEGTGGEPYINGGVFTSPATSITTRGIRTLITVPSERWQEVGGVLVGSNLGQGYERARVDEIIVDGVIPEPAALSLIGLGALLRRRK